MMQMVSDYYAQMFNARKVVKEKIAFTVSSVLELTDRSRHSTHRFCNAEPLLDGAYDKWNNNWGERAEIECRHGVMVPSSSLDTSPSVYRYQATLDRTTRHPRPFPTLPTRYPTAA